MNEVSKNLKKMINYRSSYTGTKETDILYKKYLINKVDYLNQKELILLSNLFTEITDLDILNILTKKIKPSKKYSKLFNKLLNE